MMRPDNGSDVCDRRDYIQPRSKNYKDLELQLALSLILGITAFVTFCVRILPRFSPCRTSMGWARLPVLTKSLQVLRTRWPSLYSARKRRLDPKINLPPLTDSFLGWIVRLYRVTEEQVLTTAGLDAFVVSRIIGRCTIWL